MFKNLEQRVAELEKKMKELTGDKKVKLSKNLTAGDKFELAGLTWKILDITGKGYKCLADRLEDGMKFDSNCNNWQPSELRKYLNAEVHKKLVDAVGEENIISFERNLLSLDGQTEYGTCGDKVSLLNVDEYRKYRSLIPNVDYWWWMITPWSTPCNEFEYAVSVVSPSGGVSYFDYCYCGGGVRPFVSFSSAIFESEDK